MKNVPILLFFTLMFSSFAKAQVLEDSVIMSLGIRPALTFVHKGVNAKFVDTEWSAFVKPYGKVTKVKSARETVVADIHLLDIGGAKELDIYNLNEETSDGVRTTIWINLDSGFVNSQAYPNEYVASVKFLKDFGHKVKIDQLNNELATEQKNLEKFESTLTKLVKTNESLHKTIEDSKEKIAGAEKDIEINQKNQELAQKDIDNQKVIVGEVQKREGVTSKEIDEEVKQLTKYENTYTKLKRENENLHKVIDDSNKRITDAETDIATNLESQETAQKDIDTQKGVVEEVRKNLDKAQAEKM